MAWTTYLKNKMLDHLFTDPAYTPPATLYWGISTTTPAVDGSGVTEPSGANYSRKAVTAADMSAAAAGVKENSAALNFAVPSATWNVGTHLCLFDASTGGNLLLFVDVPDKTIDNGDLVQIPAGGVDHAIA